MAYHVCSICLGHFLVPGDQLDEQDLTFAVNRRFPPLGAGDRIPGIELDPQRLDAGAGSVLGPAGPAPHTSNKKETTVARSKGGIEPWVLVALIVGGIFVLGCCIGVWKMLPGNGIPW